MVFIEIFEDDELVYKGSMLGRVINTDLDLLGYEQILRELLSGAVYMDSEGNRLRDDPKKANEIPPYLENLGFSVKWREEAAAENQGED